MSRTSVIDGQESAQGPHGATVAPAEVTLNHHVGQGTPQGRKRKHLSGAQKRKRARLKAQGTEVLPQPPIPSEQELESLSGASRELIRLHRAWLMAT